MRLPRSSSGRLLPYIGLSAAAAPWLFILAAALLSGCFNPFQHALSDLGDWETACGVDAVCRAQCSSASEPVFNWGLIISGVLVAASAMLLLRYSHGYPALLLVAGVSLSLVGVFPEHSGGLHLGSAMVFFVSSASAITVSAFSEPGVPKRQALPLSLMAWSGVLLLLIYKWLGWPGLAIPEIIVALPASILLVLVSMKQ